MSSRPSRRSLIYGLFLFGIFAFIAYGLGGLPFLIVLVIMAGIGLLINQVKDRTLRRQLFVIVTVLFVLAIILYVVLQILPYAGGLPTAD